MSERPGVILDAGAFIQLERRDRTMVRLAQLFADARTPLVTSAAVVAQVWRGGEHHQVPITFLLRRVKVVDLTYPVARLLGRMLGATGTSDPIDAHVVFLAREYGWPVLTSDPDDLRALDPGVVVEEI
jgi:PIN domain-containing protein